MIHTHTYLYIHTYIPFFFNLLINPILLYIIPLALARGNKKSENKLSERPPPPSLFSSNVINLTWEKKERKEAKKQRRKKNPYLPECIYFKNLLYFLYINVQYSTVQKYKRRCTKRSRVVCYPIYCNNIPYSVQTVCKHKKKVTFSYFYLYTYLYIYIYIFFLFPFFSFLF